MSWQRMSITMLSHIKGLLVVIRSRADSAFTVWLFATVAYCIRNSSLSVVEYLGQQWHVLFVLKLCHVHLVHLRLTWWSEADKLPPSVIMEMGPPMLAYKSTCLHRTTKKKMQFFRNGTNTYTCIPAQTVLGVELSAHKHHLQRSMHVHVRTTKTCIHKNMFISAKRDERGVPQMPRLQYWSPPHV